MSDITVELEGTEEMLANLARIDSRIRGDVAVRAVFAGGIQIQNRARINAPVLTGALRNSVSTIARNTSDGAEAIIGFRGLSYARIQEFGGTVYARKGKYLRFKYKGQWVSKTSVKVRGKHYLQRAVDADHAGTVGAMASVIKAYLGE